MDNLNNLTQARRPIAQCPLLGLTILIVEDSSFASEALRLMSTRSGARIRRADSIANARRHLAIYRPSVVIVDNGLPDGSGLALIQSLSLGSPDIDVILATSGDPGLESVARQAARMASCPNRWTVLRNFRQPSSITFHGITNHPAPAD